MNPFARFTVVFIVIVLIGLGAFLYFTGNLPKWGQASGSGPAPNSSMAPLPATPLPTNPAPVGPTASTGEMEPPPDLSGLNFPEVAIPGADLAVAPPPVESANPGDYVSELTTRHLLLPIENLPASQLHDSFNDARSGSRHEAIDIMEPTGTPVRAIDEGNIVKLFTSKKGGLTIYQFDDTRKYCYYYAHLDRYAENLKQGMLVRAGEVIGYVGSTGDANAAAPHLHFAIALLEPDKKYWKGTPLDPYPVLVKVAGQKQ